MWDQENKEYYWMKQDPMWAWTPSMKRRNKNRYTTKASGTHKLEKFKTTDQLWGHLWRMGNVLRDGPGLAQLNKYIVDFFPGIKPAHEID